LSLQYLRSFPPFRNNHDLEFGLIILLMISRVFSEYLTCLKPYVKVTLYIKIYCLHIVVWLLLAILIAVDTISSHLSLVSSFQYFTLWLHYPLIHIQSIDKEHWSYFLFCAILSADGGVFQLVEHLLTEHKAQSSNPTTTKNK
jgi:hypothetical protein